MTKIFCTLALILSIGATTALLAQRGGRGGEPVDLPDGEGKQMVETVCSNCHMLSRITQGWGYDKQGWGELIASMVTLPPDTRNLVTTYLGQHFSARTRPATVIVPGSAKVEIKEWLCLLSVHTRMILSAPAMVPFGGPVWARPPTCSGGSIPKPVR
jgi:hypothetical protein